MEKKENFSYNLFMARQCTICKKKSILVGHIKKVMSKYNPTIKKRKYPNLQWVKLSSGERIRVCAKCIKTFFKFKSK